MTETHKAAEFAALAFQAPAEEAPTPHPLSHESRATEKVSTAGDPSSPPHKRYRGNPHHSILLENHTGTDTRVVLSTTQYISDFLQSKTALSIIPESIRGNIDIVYSNQSAAQALTMLARDDIISVPVYDKELEAYVGFVDYLDLASLVVNIVNTLTKEYYPGVAIGSLDDEQKRRITHDAKREFNSKTLLEISDLSKNDPFIPVVKTANLYQAMEILAKFGIHRVPITDPEDDQKIEAILSQSSVIKFLFDNLDKFSTKARKQVSELIGSREKDTVLTITESTPSFEGFELMIKHQVSCVGVVDETGMLVGVLSGTDFRIIGPHANALALLFQPVKELLSQSRELNAQILVPVVKVTTTDTLGIVIENMEDNEVHRVFVVDEEKPLCTLSMKDVLKEFLGE